MKLVFLILFLFSGQISANHQITVHLKNLKNNNGNIRSLLFATPSGFPTDVQKALQKKEFKLNPLNNTVTFTFENVKDGVYAISVYHDENSNNKLDTNLFGVPKEGVGVSKNIIPSLSSPSFKENAFEVQEKDLSINILMSY